MNEPTPSWPDAIFRHSKRVGIRQVGYEHDTGHSGARCCAPRGPVLIQAAIASEDVPRVLPTRDGHAIRLHVLQALER